MCRVNTCNYNTVHTQASSYLYPWTSTPWRGTGTVPDRRTQNNRWWNQLPPPKKLLESPQIPRPTPSHGGWGVFDDDDHKPWRPQTCFLKTVWPWIRQFLKSMPLVFHVFIAVAVVVYLVAILVCGHHGIGPHEVGWVHVSYTTHTHKFIWNGSINNAKYKTTQKHKKQCHHFSLMCPICIVPCITHSPVNICCTSVYIRCFPNPQLKITAHGRNVSPKLRHFQTAKLHGAQC